VVSVLQWEPFMDVLGEESAFGMFKSGECNLEDWPFNMLGGCLGPAEFGA